MRRVEEGEEGEAEADEAVRGEGQHIKRPVEATAQEATAVVGVGVEAEDGEGVGEGIETGKTTREQPLLRMSKTPRQCNHRRNLVGRASLVLA